MFRWMRVTTRQWRLIEKELSRPKRSGFRCGRPRGKYRPIFEGIVWILETGSSWSKLPAMYGSPANVHRRFQEWAKDGSLDRALAAFIRHLDARQRLDWTEAFIDGSFVPAKKGALASKRRGAAKAPVGSSSPRDVVVFHSRPER